MHGCNIWRSWCLQGQIIKGKFIKFKEVTRKILENIDHTYVVYIETNKIKVMGNFYNEVFGSWMYLDHACNVNILEMRKTGLKLLELEWSSGWQMTLKNQRLDAWQSKKMVFSHDSCNMNQNATQNRIFFLLHWHI